MLSVSESLSRGQGPNLSQILLTTSILRDNSQNLNIFTNNCVLNFTPNSDNTTAEVAQPIPLEWGMMGLTLIIACTTVGNLLVCLAVCWEKRLQNMTNYFLMSLAIADLLVSLLVMPLGMIVEIFGRFPMHPEVCVLWVSSDVLMCSASIWHMCTMSMDRYFTLKYPMRYGRNKTRRMVAGKILFVWVVSVAISSPVCIHGFIDTSSVFRNGECVPKVKNFVIYGSVFAFYIPLLIMIVTYVLTIRILWKNQLRMKHIERSDLKPRLAQLTAQCSGLAIPKLFTSFRRASKFRTALVVPRARKQLLPPDSAAALNIQSLGKDNFANDVDNSDDSGGGRGRNNLGMVYLAPPSPQTCTTGSCSPSSAHVLLNSDTDDSESETNYFSLLQSSCRSLSTPISLTTSEKSLHKRLQKRQLYQQQQQELHLLRQEYHQQRQQHHNNDEEPSMSSSPPEDNSKEDCSWNHSWSFSVPTSPTSHELTPFMGEPIQLQHPATILTTSSLSTSSSAPKLYRKPSNEIKEIDKKRLKKKRFSKRSKKRRNSLIQDGSQTDHLTVPCPVYFRRGHSSKISRGQTVLTNAVSDTQVSQAGRCCQLGSKENDKAVTSFHLSYNNLSKDYKSLEWDRRYFQIQEEMDRCLQGEYGPKDRRHSRQEQTYNALTDDDVNDGHPDKKLLLKPEISLPMSDPLNVCNSKPVYSHSAPNSPLNRRNVDFLKTTQLSDDDVDDGDDDDDREYELENEENSDKTNDDEGNDTSGSSNSDVVTIRLHPPTPKVKIVSNVDSCSDVTFEMTSTSESPSFSASQNISSLTVPDLTILTHNKIETEAVNGVPIFCNSINNNKNTTNHINNSLVKGNSVYSLSPGSNSPLPELVISSEGEMTLEETDDTVDDSPKHHRVKLRRPNQRDSQFRLRRQPSPGHRHGDKYNKSRRPTFRNTFRIHRKGAVKHILSKKTATNERKASKVLGIIFLVFVTLWTPFFAVNIVNAACDTCMDNFNKEMMSLFLWMGYIASLANPIIYTMFNTAFRRTFIKILTCKIGCTRRSQASEAHYISCTTMLASERRNTVTVVLRDDSR